MGPGARREQAEGPGEAHGVPNLLEHGRDPQQQGQYTEPPVTRTVLSVAEHPQNCAVPFNATAGERQARTLPADLGSERHVSPLLRKPDGMGAAPAEDEGLRKPDDRGR